VRPEENPREIKLPYTWTALILRIQDQYEEAQLKLEEAKYKFITIGDRLRATQCVRELNLPGSYPLAAR